jgi:hypothetical protein
MAYHGLGAAVVKACAANAQYNQQDDTCYCNPGFISSDPTTKACKPIDVNVPCEEPTERRRPVDKKCYCPPGTMVNPDPKINGCIPGVWFPDCVDAAGVRVPNCYYGMPANRAYPAMAVGLGAGLALALLFKVLT